MSMSYFSEGLPPGSVHPHNRDRTFPVVEGGHDRLPRIGTVQSMAELPNHDVLLTLSTGQGTIELTVRGDIRALLGADRSVFINNGSVVPKMDEFAPRRRSPPPITWDSPRSV